MNDRSGSGSASVSAPGTVGVGPASVILPAARQTVLDAAAVLQVHRSELASRLAVAPRPDARVVAVGRQAWNQWPTTVGASWRELLLVKPYATAAQLRAILPTNRRLVEEHGVQMVSLYDYYGLDLDGRLLIANETVGAYVLGAGPVQMLIVDRRFVVLQGPEVDGEVSIMEVTAPACMEAAWRYWDAAIASTLPRKSAAGPDSLTPRQRQIVALLASDLTDEAIATSLGVSVRTVRSDVAALMETLGVRSRFAAGVRLQLWSDD
jgi:DNA-binding CsgD family transcriptional regulator